MANYSNLTSNKVYSILFIGDYEKGTPSWRKYVDTLINNLLDKPPSAEWVKYENLPKITVSIVDKAETRAQAFDKLSTVKYDVVFVDTVVNGQPNGAGIIGRYYQFQQSSMYIPLLAPTQIKGAVKKDGTICDGAGITLLYNKGFYNGVVKKDLNLGKLIEMILAGGRSKEDAFIAYGLDYGQAKLEEDIHTVSDAGKVENMDTVQATELSVSSNDNMAILLETAQLFPEFSLNQIKVLLEDADNNLEKLRVVSSMYHTKTNLPDAFGWVRSTIGYKAENNSNEPVSVQEPEPSVKILEVMDEEVKDKPIVTQIAEADSLMDNNSPAAGEYNGEKPPNRKQRRAMRRQQELEAQGRTEKPSLNDENSHSNDTVQTLSVSLSTQQNLSNPNTVSDPYLQEIEQMQASGALQERGTFNNGLVQTGVIHGNIMFAKGTTVLVELAVDLDVLGLRLPDIYNAPVVIPYSKFGMGDIKKDV